MIPSPSPQMLRAGIAGMERVIIYEQAILHSGVVLLGALVLVD